MHGFFGRRVGATLTLVVLLAGGGSFSCDSGGGTPAPDAPDMEPGDPGADAAPPDAEAEAEASCLRDSDCPSGRYCAGSGAAGRCAAGCRTEPDSCAAADRLTACDPDARACAPRSCEVDDACPADAWCDEGACALGCRLSDDACGPDLDGFPQGCSPESRTCARVVPCCDPDDACTMAVPDVCRADGGDLLRLPTSCMPDPCTAICDDDADCDEDDYCSPDRRCAPGCRPGDRAACPPDTACEPGARRCQTLNCNRDADCPDWQYCGGGLCFDGCRLDTDTCPDGARCAADHICRAGCADDVDCGDAGYCDRARGACRPACVPETHAGCTDGERCADERCVAGCADDPAEAAGDDTPRSAPSLVFARVNGIEDTGTIDLVACPGDLDLRAVPVPRGEQIEAVLSWDRADGLLTLRLVDDAGAPVAEGVELGGDLRIRWRGALERVYVEVGRIGDGAPVPYRLRARRVPADGCLPDARDPVDDRREGATIIGQGPRAAFSERWIGDTCADDVDWYCFPMTADDGLGITVLTEPACEGLSGRVAAEGAFDDPGAGWALSVDAVDGLRRSALRVDPLQGAFTDGIWCLRLASESDCADYDLTVAFDRRGEICTDLLEPDDQPDDATPLDGDGPLADFTGRLPAGVDLVYPAEARACRGDVDRYRVEARAGDLLQASAIAEDDADALLIGFADADGRPIGGAGTGRAGDGPLADGPAAVVLASADGPLFVEVSSTRRATPSYRLLVRRDDADALCVGDTWEADVLRDDDGANARRLRSTEPGRFEAGGAAICAPGGDTDWYRIDGVAPLSRVCVDAAFDHALGDLNLQVFRAPEGECRPVMGETCCPAGDCPGELACVAGFCRTPLAEGDSLTDGEVFAVDGALLDTVSDVLVRVERAPGDQGGRSTPYGLTVTRTAPGPGPCARDWQERSAPNDDRATATRLGAGQTELCDAWICADERETGDWYRFTVPAGQDRTAYLEFTAGDGRLLLTAVDPFPDPERLAESLDRRANVQCINLAGGEADREVLLAVTADTIAADGQGRVDYVLRIVPTDLETEPGGSCATLSGGVPPGADWPTLDLD